LDVLVQDVMAAIRMSPFLTWVPALVVKVRSSFSAGWLKPFSATGLEYRSMKVFLTLPISMRSCGRSGGGHAEHLLGLEIGLERGDFVFGAAGAAEVVDGALVDGEETHGGAVFGRHVADGGAFGHGQAGRAFAAELDELAHHFFTAQHFGDGQHQVGGGDAAAQLALELHADHVGGQEVDGLAQHAGFRLDAAHAPAHHADAVDHGGVAVGAHQRVGVVDVVLLVLVHAARQVFQVHLVDDAEARGHDAEGVERLHAPLHELVALLVALEFQLHVQVQRILGAEVVDHDGVVHHQVHRHQGLDALGALAHLVGHRAHGGDVGQQRHAGEVLQHHPGHDEGDLVFAAGVGLPVGELPDVFFGDFLAIAVAQHRFQDDPDRDREPLHVDAEGLAQRRQRIVLTGFIADLEILEGV
jgi:hypothetical protein